MHTRFYGSPGMSAWTLARTRSRRRRFGAVAGAVLAGAALTVGWIPVAVATVAATAISVRRGERRIAQARAGTLAEAAAARHLARTHAEAVMFDVTLGPGDVDVVVLGPQAGAVEIKRGAGRVRVRPDGRVTAGGRRLPGHPGRQVVAGATRLANLLGPAHRVDPILCVTEMRGWPRRVAVGSQRVWVCSSRHLPRVVRRLPRRLERGEGRRLAERLATTIDPSLVRRRRV